MLAEALIPEEYHRVEKHLLEGIGSHKSFGNLLKEVVSHNPEAYILTAYSAVPLADTLRGYYDHVGLSVPEIHYVRADTSASRHMLERREMVKQEIARLSGLKNLESVSVIDQFRATGGSLDMAVDVLVGLNIKNILPIAGMWYQDANPEDVNLEAMSSTHNELMYEIGRKAAAFS